MRGICRRSTVRSRSKTGWWRPLAMGMVCGVVALFGAGCQRFCHTPCGPKWLAFPPPPWKQATAKVPFVEVHKYSVFVSPYLATWAPQRIVVIPTGTESGKYQAPAQFAESLASAIRMAGLAEVVVPPHFDCSMTVDRLLAGQFDEWDIVSLANRWRCDAVLFVRVNQLQAHAPLSASVTAALVDARESMVIFAVDGNWDTTDPEIRAGFEHFVQLGAADLSHPEAQLQMQAPNRLFAYVARQMTSAWVKGLGR